jgi:prophage DNA circulation protein
VDKVDALDAQPIVIRCLQHLAACIPQVGIPAAQARATIGATIAHTATLLAQDTIGPPLQNCFDQVQAVGATQLQIQTVRIYTEAEQPKTLGGTLLQNSCLALCLATEAEIIVGMTFTSRQDIDAMLQTIQAPYARYEEIAADKMDQMTFQGLIGLQAALTNHLMTTARPLPRMIAYEFAQVLPSLVLAYRLYADASRGDELRAENKIVHPLFCPAAGMALSR